MLSEKTLNLLDRMNDTINEYKRIHTELSNAFINDTDGLLSLCVLSDMVPQIYCMESSKHDKTLDTLQDIADLGSMRYCWEYENFERFELSVSGIKMCVLVPEQEGK